MFIASRVAAYGLSIGAKSGGLKPVAFGARVVQHCATISATDISSCKIRTKQSGQHQHPVVGLRRASSEERRPHTSLTAVLK